MASRLPIAVCIIAGNEAARIRGVLESVAGWTTEIIVVLNNDVLIPSGCLEGLIRFAAENKYDVVCPAMREGDLDYDWQAHAQEFMNKMRNVHRNGVGHGVCFMVHRLVFEKIGYFKNFGGYEDDDFFRRARAAGFRMAITGRGWLHHFGSITQKAIKPGEGRPVGWGDRDHYREQTGQTWLKRKVAQVSNGLRATWWQNSERLRYGWTLREQRIAGTLKQL